MRSSVSTSPPIEPVIIDDLVGIRTRLQRARSTKKLMDLTFAELKAFRVINICYAHAPPIGAVDYKHPAIVDARGLPKGWGVTYAERGYAEVDAVSRLALSQTRPFYWRDVRKMKRLSTKEKAYLAHLREHGINHGICIPTHGPKGRSGYFGVGLRPDFSVLSDRQLYAIEWICQTAHLCHCSILADTSPKIAALSTREREVLWLILAGCSNVEIAERLNVSNHSTSTYLRRASKKLSINGRFETATRALALGLLD